MCLHWVYLILSHRFIKVHCRIQDFQQSSPQHIDLLLFIILKEFIPKEHVVNADIRPDDRLITTILFIQPPTNIVQNIVRNSLKGVYLSD